VHAYRAAQHSSSTSNSEQRNGGQVADVTANGVTEKTVPVFEGIHLVFRYSAFSILALYHIVCAVTRLVTLVMRLVLHVSHMRIELQRKLHAKHAVLDACCIALSLRVALPHLMLVAVMQRSLPTLLAHETHSNNA
jgi:hypothetical protein